MPGRQNKMPRPVPEAPRGSGLWGPRPIEEEGERGALSTSERAAVHSDEPELKLVFDWGSSGRGLVLAAGPWGPSLGRSLPIPVTGMHKFPAEQVQRAASVQEHPQPYTPTSWPLNRATHISDEPIRKNTGSPQKDTVKPVTTEVILIQGSPDGSWGMFRGRLP